MAIEHEKQSKVFYEKAAQNMDDPGTRKMFEELARQEIEHQRILEEELDREIYREN
jgi:rubrerythrin